MPESQAYSFARESSSSNFGDQLRWRYIAALSLIALLTMLSQVVVQYLISDQEFDSHLVNIAGRQRMLSQKVTKVAMYLQEANTGLETEAARKELGEALHLWERSHQGLQLGDAELGLPGENSPAIAALFAQIEPNFQAMRSSATRLLEPDLDALAQRIARNMVRANEAAFLTGMNAIVFNYDQEAKNRVSMASRLELGLMLVTLLVLAIEAWFIFAPAVRRIRQDMFNLQRRESDLTNMLAASPIALLVVRSDGLQIFKTNPKACELLGHSDAALQNHSLDQLLDSDAPSSAVFLEQLHHGEAISACELVLLGASGVKVDVLTGSGQTVIDDQACHVIGISDIGDLKRANRQLAEYHQKLLHADKLASVGKLAAGVAHEINTPLGFVRTNLNVLQGHSKTLLALASDQAIAPSTGPEHKELEQEMDELFTESREGIDRISDIVKNLKSFARPDQALVMMPVDLNDCCRQSLRLIQHEIASKADLVCTYADLPMVPAKAPEINQALVNLLSNAMHALPMRGIIELRTGCDDSGVWVEVQDNGCGIDDKIRSRIFEPFFTTKPVGSGTGLGLSISYGIALAHGGKIDFEPGPVEGTIFRLWLPRVGTTGT